MQLKSFGFALQLNHLFTPTLIASSKQISQEYPSQRESHPWSSSTPHHSFHQTQITTPLNPSSVPILIWIGQRFATKERVFNCRTTEKKFGPLYDPFYYEYQKRGTSYFIRFDRQLSQFWGLYNPKDTQSTTTATRPESTQRIAPTFNSKNLRAQAYSW